mgnify:CR=1 FL=1
MFVLLFAVSCEVGEASLPVFIEGLPNLASYFSDLTPMIRMNHIGEDVAEWYWGIGKWLKLLWDTILMAFLGTFLGTIMAFLLCFPASANLMPLKPVYFITRRITEFARAVPELVYAMIFVFSFGIGPFPGILAIAIHTAGALGKLFSEVNENLDEKAIEGVRASGGNWFEVIRFAERHQADGIVTSRPVDPRLERIAAQIESQCPLERLEPEPFVTLPRPPRLGRFSRYWREAEPVVWEGF